jgi:anti-sigma B factor antagonist
LQEIVGATRSREATGIRAWLLGALDDLGGRLAGKGDAVIEASPFEIRSEVEGERGRLVLTGELDLAVAPRVQEAAEELLAHRVRRLTLDLAGLTFIDCSGLRMLIALNDRAAGADWTLGLIRPEPSLPVLQITGAEESLPFVEEPGAQ